MTKTLTLRLPGSLAVTAFLALAGLVLGAASATAQGTPAPPASAIGETVEVAPGPEYEAGGLHATILGTGWRDLWTTPVNAEVFGFDEFAGGVDWTERGGGNQSITLHLEAQDGWREYIFRSVNKFPEQAMPDPIRGTTVGWVVGDMISALLPAAPLLVPPFLEALDVLHVEPVLRVMPDDPRLEVYQDTFAGMMGTVEIQPNEAPDDQPGYAESSKIKGSEEFLNDIEDSKDHRLDEREFLATRYVDFLINDTDRTRDNTRWARFGQEGAYHWRPLPIDRDWAFLDATGWVSALIRTVYPKFVSYGPEFAPISALAYSSFLLDRRLLQRLTRDDFAAVAEVVQAAITDEVIEASIARMPEQWRNGTDAPDRIRTSIRGRRDRLPDLAMDFYDFLAAEVEVRGTDEPDRATIERFEDGRVRISITWPEDDPRAGRLFYDRTFLPDETSEIRLFLHGDDDVARVIGAGSDAITVRVIGGGSDDRLVDEAGGGATAFYDARGDNEIVPAGGTHVSRKEWNAPEPTEGLRLGGDWVPDWGGGSGWSPTVGYGDAAGVFLGVGPTWTDRGFRRLPYHWKLTARGLYALRDNSFGAEVLGDYRLENSPLALTLEARGTRFHGFRFYGYGNDTPDIGDPSLVDQDRVVVNPALTWHIGWRDREGDTPLIRRDDVEEAGPMRDLVGQLDVGPTFLWTDARPEAGSPLATSSLLGTGSLSRAGARAALALDRTDRDGVPRRGWRAAAYAAGFPAMGEIPDGFAEGGAELSGYIPLIGDGPHLALRAGGSAVTGTFPVQHSAFIGGRSTLRGYRWQRFRGDRAAYGSAELRVPVTDVELLIRWDVGVFGLADAGRVWMDGESAGHWHTGFGGGVWFHAFGNVISAAWARGEEDRYYLQLGAFF